MTDKQLPSDQIHTWRGLTFKLSFQSTTHNREGFHGYAFAYRQSAECAGNELCHLSGPVMYHPSRESHKRWFVMLPGTSGYGPTFVEALENTQIDGMRQADLIRRTEELAPRDNADDVVPYTVVV